MYSLSHPLHLILYVTPSRSQCDREGVTYEINLNVMCNQSMHDRERVTYEIKCNECDSEYIGETARNAYTRVIEHLEALKKKNERSLLWRHCEEKHDNEIQEFRMNVTGMYNNDSMAR